MKNRAYSNLNHFLNKSKSENTKIDDLQYEPTL